MKKNFLFLPFNKGEEGGVFAWNLPQNPAKTG